MSGSEPIIIIIFFFRAHGMERSSVRCCCCCCCRPTGSSSSSSFHWQHHLAPLNPSSRLFLLSQCWLKRNIILIFIFPHRLFHVFFYVTCFNNGVVSLSVYLNVDSVKKKKTFCLVSSSTDLRSAAQVSLLVSELRGHISTKSIWKNSCSDI